MTLQMVYILPMILGRTFDLKNARVGIDIFPPDQLALQTINVASGGSNSTSKIILSSQDVQHVLNIPLELVLKVKAEFLNIKGSGAYLKNSGTTDNVVEVLTKMKFSTRTVSLPYKAKPFPDWVNHRSENLGTHYVKSITYGGELIASLKFKAHRKEDLLDIQAKVSAEVKGVNLKSLLVSGKMKKLKQELYSKANLEIIYFATVPLKTVPNTLEGLQTLIECFGDHVKSIDNGSGVPVSVELVKLSALDNQFTFRRNRVLTTALRRFESQFDDLRRAKTKMTTWIKSLPPTLTENEEKMINDLYERIVKVARSFYGTIGKLDIEKGPEQLQNSQRAYNEGETDLPGKFSKEFERMKKEMVVKESRIVSSTDLGRSTYFHWGSDSCNNATSTNIFSGYLASDSQEGLAGGNSFLCFPKAPYLGGKLDSVSRTDSFVIGTKYGFTEITRSIFGKGIFCSACHIGNRSSIVILAASTECRDGWVTEYKGYLATTDHNEYKLNYICLDKQIHHYTANRGDDRGHSMYVVGKKNSENNEHVVISCVVCSK